MISIKPILFNNVSKPCSLNKRSEVSLPAPLSFDTVSFSGRQKDLLDLSEEEIFDKIKKSINATNFIGKGNEASVYNLPDTDYVVRLLKNQEKPEKYLDYKKDLSFDLTTDDRINHVAARLGNGCCILRRLDGESCFKYKNKKEFFNLPVDSYHKLYKQICFAKDNNMIFDVCDSNIIYNPKDKSLTAIDFYKNTEEFPENVRPLVSIFSSIAYSVEGACPETKKLFGGLVNTAIKELESGAKCPQDVANLDIHHLFAAYESYNHYTMPPQFDILKSKIVEAQCLKLKEFIGEDVKNELQGTLKVANALVNQLYLKDDSSILNKLKLKDDIF